MIKLHLRRLDLPGVTRDRMRTRVSIHESADVPGAERFRAESTGIPTSALKKTTPKKHDPSTTRKNTTESHLGCLVIYASNSADLYRRGEGAWYGIVLGVVPATRRKCLISWLYSPVV